MRDLQPFHQVRRTSLVNVGFTMHTSRTFGDPKRKQTENTINQNGHPSVRILTFWPQCWEGTVASSPPRGCRDDPETMLPLTVDVPSVPPPFPEHPGMPGTVYRLQETFRTGRKGTSHRSMTA